MRTDPNSICQALLCGIDAAIKDNVEGIYLYGSLATGDFDEDVSDIDLLAVLREPLREEDLSALRNMHCQVEETFTDWRDRVEVAYVPRSALETFRQSPSVIAVISPGEPLHFKDAGIDWLINWYVVQEQGKAVVGPAFRKLIEPITSAEYLRSVRDQTEEWRSYVHEMDSRPAQGYAILTLCRALYSHRHGRQASKAEAARYAAAELPRWADLIGFALAWRTAHRDPVSDPEATKEKTVAFVLHVADLISEEGADRLGPAADART